MKQINKIQPTRGQGKLHRVLLLTTSLVVAGSQMVNAFEPEFQYVWLSDYAEVSDNFDNLPDSGYLFTVNNDTADYDAQRLETFYYDDNGNLLYEDISHVVLLDLTAGFQSNDSIVNADGEFEDFYVNGRAAFYLKGKIKGKYLISASMDTENGPLMDIFRDFDSKDAHSVLDRIDPDLYYPVYGDDSTIEQDTPTNGSFFVRIENDDDSFLWGNFTATIEGTDYLHNHRALYGAEAIYRSDEKTSFGAPRTSSIAYVARVETVPQRDTLLGTGGSAYFLRRQDIRVNSEIVTVVVRDSESGHVIEEMELHAGEDYDIDYMQGVILLKTPVHATEGTQGVVREGVLGDTNVYLVAQYEYTPTLIDIDGYTYGGRVEHWVNDRVAVGVTGLRNSDNISDQKSIGANVHFLIGEKSSADIEYARTTGGGYGGSSSNDGGLTYFDAPTAGTDQSAGAYILHYHGDFSDIFGPSVVGTVDAHYENIEAGFSTLDHEVSEDRHSWGIEAHYAASDQMTISGFYDGYSDASGNKIRTGEVSANYTFTDKLQGEFGIQHHESVAIGIPSETGSRTDIAARLAYDFDDDQSIYGFVQSTIATTEGHGLNDRYGIGGEVRLTEHLKLVGEISEGSTGPGRQLMFDIMSEEGDHYYIGYRLDPEHKTETRGLSGAHEGSFVVGTQQHVNEHLSGYAELTHDIFGDGRSGTTSFGATYNPTPEWTFTGGMELGTIRDDASGNFDRMAPSFGISYRLGDQFASNVRFEGRWEDGEGIEQDRTSYLVTSQSQYKIDDSNRIMMELDAAISHSDQSALLDGEFLEATIGYAYRPISNDRLNVLLKYTYLYDMPGPDQLSVDGSSDGPKQESSILGIDATYDVTEKFSIGAKYGYRMASVADRGSDIFSPNTAHLGILRGDFHIAKEWDGLIEGRALWTEETDIVETGFTAAIYRHFGDDFKAGVGYHFGNVNSDLRSFDNTNKGWFFNVIAKY